MKLGCGECFVFLLSGKPSSIQTIMEMECYELEVLKALRTKRNVASVVLLSVLTSLILLWILKLSWDQHTEVESAEEYDRFYGSTRLLLKG